MKAVFSGGLLWAILLVVGCQAESCWKEARDDVGQEDSIGGLDLPAESTEDVSVEIRDHIPHDEIWDNIPHDSYSPGDDSDFSEADIGEAVPPDIPADPSVVKAVIRCQEGDRVRPLTTLHLSGLDSITYGSAINHWEWHVQAPKHSGSSLQPDAYSAEPTFLVDVAGGYVFSLRVCNETRMCSVHRAYHEVIVLPDSDIYVEVSWTGATCACDPDLLDGKSADLDLHFLHPWASGPDLDGDGEPDGWFDHRYDCFWFNPNPDWGSMFPAEADDPALVAGDTETCTMEAVALNHPEPDSVYRIGVHYWRDRELGPVLATVRVYVFAALVFEAADVLLKEKDLWEVATISWPLGKVTSVTTPEGTHKITHHYDNPYFR
jgi:hypothetical protein